VANSDFTLMPFAAAVERLNLAAHFGGHLFDQYGEDGRKVLYYEKRGTIEGDIDLDAMYYNDKVAGIFAKQDLTVTGTIKNWEIDTTAAFLAVGRDLACANLVAGCADIRVRRDLKADGVIVATYNHGYMEVSRDVIARYLIIDDHTTIVGCEVKAAGFKEAANAIAELPDSDWASEIRPEFKDEFFRGEMLCGNGNVELIQALLAGRDILRADAQG
jgi:hypothetical protein